MDTIKLGQSVVQIELDEVGRLYHHIDYRFERAIKLIMACTGRLVVVGMGKSGIIGRKIAATMASTGTSSFFVHPAEAFHGDLGMIRAEDVVLMISSSGETEELIRLLPFMKFQGNQVIAMTGNSESTLSKNANVMLDVSVTREACNNNLAPTSSTTVALVMGDALAVTLSTLKNFQPEDFARFHPGGNLGRRLLSKVSDVMVAKNLPTCNPSTTLRAVVGIITRARLGLALVMDENKLVGIITDGDLRRALENNDEPLQLTAKQFMTQDPFVISADCSLADAEKMMMDLKKRVLVVVDGNRIPSGILQIFDLDK